MAQPPVEDFRAPAGRLRWRWRALPLGARETLFYGLGEMAIRGSELALVPVYGRLAGAETYGVIEVARVITSFWTIFVLAGQHESVLRFAASAHPERRRRVVGSLVVATLLFAVLATAAAHLVVGGFGIGVLLQGSHRGLVAAALWTGVWAVPVMLTLALLRAERRARFYMLLQLLQGGLLVGGTTAALLVVEPMADVAVYARLVAVMAVGLVSLVVWLRAATPVRVDAGEIRAGLHYGVPLLGHTLTWQVLNAADRFVLQGFLPLAAVGRYAAAYGLSVTLSLVITVYNRALLPSLFRNETRTAYVRARVLIASRHLPALCALGGVVLALVAAPLLGFLGRAEGFDQAAGVVAVVTSAYVLLGVYQAMANVVWLSGRTMYSFGIGAVAAAANLGLNFVLVPPMGLMGAAYATLGSFLVLALLTYVAARALVPAVTPGPAALVPGIVGTGLVLAAGAVSAWDGGGPTRVWLAASVLVAAVGVVGAETWRAARRLREERARVDQGA